MDKYITYSEYLSEQVEKNIDYTEYLSGKMDNISYTEYGNFPDDSINYSEYIAENIDPERKQREKIRKIREDKINDLLNGV